MVKQKLISCFTLHILYEIYASSTSEKTELLRSCYSGLVSNYHLVCFMLSRLIHEQYSTTRS